MKNRRANPREDLTIESERTGKSENEDKILGYKFFKGKTDDEILKMLYPTKKKKGSSVPCYYNDWHYYKPDPRFGIKHVARIPGQAVLGLLYFYTNPGDLIVDPFAGGGVTIDTCRVMNRRCLAYDIEPDRPDISQNDIRNGYPLKAQSCEMVILDPPYSNMIFRQYFKKHNDFYLFMKGVADETYRILKKGGKVALFMADKTGYDRACLTSVCYKIFTEAGLKWLDTIGLSHSYAICTGQHVNWAKKNRRLLGVRRVIYVFKKPIRKH